MRELTWGQRLVCLALLGLLGLGGGAIFARRVAGQPGTPPPCEDVLALHRQLADQVQDQLVRELAVARRALLAVSAAPPAAR